ncbi:hypothetical protein PV433_30570 [Paenibacillus sp. GYB004]|uniref:YbjN domain-containing protein n=1 Tax=Paenibacillus sp. GYB004 TaxID=2994393 RepID=UPI002F9698A4
MSNVTIFRDALNQKNVYMEELKDDQGGTFFRADQRLENGGSVLLVVSFNEREDIVDLNVYNIAKITNPLKKESIHNLINDLNIDYRFTKFMEQNGVVSAQYSLTAEQNKLDAGRVLEMLIMLLRSAEDNYPKFMKLQWA